jgi:hypothetical protein
VSARSHVDEDGQEGDVVLTKHTVDAKELARLYVGELLTAEEVAKRIGCSETTVRRRLHSQALDVRSRGSRRREPAAGGWSRERAYVIGASMSGSRALVFHRQKAGHSVHSRYRMSISRTLPAGASMAMDRSSCTWTGIIPTRMRAMSMNACMSRLCPPVERSSIGSGPACYDSWESSVRSRRDRRDRGIPTGCFAMHGASPGDCCPDLLRALHSVPCAQEGTI